MSQKMSIFAVEIKKNRKTRKKRKYTETLPPP